MNDKNIEKVIDISYMNKLYEESKKDDSELDITKIAPLKCVIAHELDKKENYSEIGRKIVNRGEYAIVLMAGGNGSRLGLGPKGCIKIKLGNRDKSLFEIYIDQLKDVFKKESVYINLYIMTSDDNYEEILSFFKNNSYFDYPKEYIRFFKQSKLPILNTEGKIVFKDENNVLFGPNGNGDVFRALKESGLLEDITKQNIKYLLFSTIDNVLTKLVDMCFMGTTVSMGYSLASKTLTKKSPREKDWIFCKYNDKPYMLPSKYLIEEVNNAVDNKGNYLYREKNITYHLISTELVNRFCNIDLKYHRAFKKYNFIDETGKKVNSDEPNAFKFEKFIFDAFSYADDMLLYRIDESEFCPIKTQADLEKAEKELNKHYGKERK